MPGRCGGPRTDPFGPPDSQKSFYSCQPCAETTSGVHTTLRFAFASGVSAPVSDPLSVTWSSEEVAEDISRIPRPGIDAPTFALQRPQHPVHIYAFHGLHLRDCFGDSDNK